MTVILLVNVNRVAESRSEQNCRRIGSPQFGVVPNVPSLWGATRMSLMHQGQLSLMAGLVRYRSRHLGRRQWSVVRLTLYEWCTRCTIRSRWIWVTPVVVKVFWKKGNDFCTFYLIWVLANVRHSWLWLIGSPPCIKVWMKVNSHVLGNDILSLIFWVKTTLWFTSTWGTFKYLYFKDHRFRSPGFRAYARFWLKESWGRLSDLRISSVMSLG